MNFCDIFCFEAEIWVWEWDDSQKYDRKMTEEYFSLFLPSP